MVSKTSILITTIIAIEMSTAINIPFIGSITMKTRLPKNNTQTPKPSAATATAILKQPGKPVENIESPKFTPPIAVSEDLESDPAAENSSSSPLAAAKYEFENETLDSENSAEIPLDCVNYTIIAPGQEIDETRNCSTDKAQVVSPGLNQTHGMEKILKSFPKPSFTFPNKKTVTFTKTVVTEHTEYETVHPSCLRLHHVQSVCDFSVTTIQPTSTLDQYVQPSKTATVDEENTDYDDAELPENRREKRNAPVVESSRSSVAQYDEDYLESSEVDETILASQHLLRNKATPTPEKYRSKQPETVSSIITSILLDEPKIHFVTEHLTVYTTKTYTDHGTTATVHAYNCVPPNLNVRLCDPIVVIPYKGSDAKTNQRVTKERQSTTTTEGSSDEVKVETEKPKKSANILDRLNEYFLTNGQSLLERTGYETIDLDTDSVVVEPAASSGAQQVEPMRYVWGESEPADE